MQRQFLLGTLWGIGQGGKEIEPLCEVADRLEMGRALEGALTRGLPVGNSLRPEPRLGVVMCQHFRLLLNGLGELCLQGPRNALMVLLPRAPEQRLIGSLLD